MNISFVPDVMSGILCEESFTDGVTFLEDTVRCFCKVL